MKNMSQYINGNLFKLITKASRQLNYDTYVVGGYVRDLLLKRPSNDIDVVTVGSGIELARKTAGLIDERKEVKYYGRFGTAMIRMKDKEIEFVGARKESYDPSSRKPFVENGTLEDDQNRRDFTINAMAISLNEDTFGALIDPFNGVQDLQDKIIRTPLNPDVTYSDDPLRMMRAIRFATQLDFTIEKESFEAIKRNAHRIKIISMERVSDELNKIMLSDKPSIGYKLLDASGLLDIIFPQLSDMKGVEIQDGRGHKDNFYHTMDVLDNVASANGGLWLRWAALLHDIAKPLTKKYDKETGWSFHGHEIKGSKMAPKIFAALKLPLNEKMKYVQKLISLHLRPIALVQDEVTDSAVRRLLFDAGDDIDDLMILCDADITSKNEEKRNRYHSNFQLVRKKLKEIEEKDHLRNWQPPVNGEMIMATFGITEGRTVGIIKNAIREAVLDGVIGNNFADAYDYMKSEGLKLGLTIKHEIKEPMEVKHNGPVPSKNER